MAEDVKKPETKPASVQKEESSSTPITAEAFKELKERLAALEKAKKESGVSDDDVVNPTYAVLSESARVSAYPDIEHLRKSLTLQEVRKIAKQNKKVEDEADVLSYNVRGFEDEDEYYLVVSLASGIKEVIEYKPKK